MTKRSRACPDCDVGADSYSRRDFIKTTGALAAAASAAPLWPAVARAADAPASTPESLVKVLYDSLKPNQREAVCFAWDYQHPEKGLLRTRVENNWNITDEEVKSDFFTADQQDLIRQIFDGMVQPDWISRFDKQLDDDAGGFGHSQSIAIFGEPGQGKFEFVMTGRHMTVRCDGDSTDHVAFGGPIFYGHAADGNFDEDPTHPNNVFWHQALEANKIFDMLDGKQRDLALVANTPRESANAFRGSDGPFPGIPIAELSGDQREQAQKVLQTLIEPYRQSDRDEVVACLKAQGGLDKCSLAFYQDSDIGDDNVWDCWRLEGPAFVWYFRGNPHVHVWVNVADDPSVAFNA